MRKLHRQLCAALLALCAMAAPALAQDQWPTKPVRFIIPYPPGGSTDIIGRPYMQLLSEKFGQQFVIENKPGASGAIGLEATAKAAPDGYTFTLVAAASAVAMPALRTALPYRPFEDLVPVGRVSTLALVVAVTPAVEAKTLQEFVALAKKNPSKFLYGTAGLGATSHFAGEHLKQLTGIDITSVPYRGSSEVQNDFLGNHVQMMLDGQILPHLKAGKGQLLAYIDMERHPDFPDVPTMRELLPEWQIYIWFGVLAPAGTPRPIIDRLNAALNEIGRRPDIKERLRPVSQRPITDTPADFAAVMKKDFALYSRLVKELNMKVE